MYQESLDRIKKLSGIKEVPQSGSDAMIKSGKFLSPEAEHNWADMIDMLQGGWVAVYHRAKKESNGVVTYVGDPSYSFTFNVDNPFKVVASDGSEITLNYLSDIEEYASDFLENLDLAGNNWFDGFRFGERRGQEEHELGRLHGDYF